MVLHKIYKSTNGFQRIKVRKNVEGVCVWEELYRAGAPFSLRHWGKKEQKQLSVRHKENACGFSSL